MRSALAVASVVVLTGCSALEPYPTFPRQPGPGEDASLTRVAICYDRLASSLDKVQAAAQQECAPNTVATPIDTDWYLQYCPLLLPSRATFTCTPRK
jgi:hypothetical protein